MYRVSRDDFTQPALTPNRPARPSRGDLFCSGVALLLLLAGCGRVQQANPATPDSYAVTLAADPAPPVVGDALVILYFMHLKTDSRWFAFIFLVPFLLVFPMVLVLRLN